MARTSARQTRDALIERGAGWWNQFVTSGMEIGVENPDYRRLYLTNTLLLTAAFLFGFFTCITLFVTKQYLIAAVDFCGMCVALFTILYLRRTRHLSFASSILVGMVFGLTLLSIYFDTYPNLNLAWVYVIPLTAILLLNLKWGLRIVSLYALFYLAILILKADSVMVIDKGPAHYANLFGVLLAVTLLTRYSETSRQKTHESLKRALEREAAGKEELRVALEELRLYRQSLEQRVAESVEELRQKDRLLIQQSRMASMGEMLAMIAHQLKQPIQTISIVTQDAQEAYRDNELDEEHITHLAKSTMQSVQYMSDTIDDLRNFLNPNKKRGPFSLKKSIQKGLDIIAPRLRRENVKVRLEGEDQTLFGLSSEIQQMMINLVANSMDAMREREVEEKRIEIEILREEPFVTVVVSDNGGGIDESISPHLFQSYATSRENDGTGLGLYMVKLIVQSMEGDVSVVNTEEGAELKIRFPLDLISVP